MTATDHDNSTNTSTATTMFNSLRITLSRLTKKPPNLHKLRPLKFSPAIPYV